MSFDGVSGRYPELFREMHWAWGPITAQFRLTDVAPEESTISQVRIVPFIGNRVVIIDKGENQWDHPGGTLEPGESWVDAMRREALEEAGAEILNFNVFGSLDCVSQNEQPYRQHLPFPNFSQVVVYADVELASNPHAPREGDFEEIKQVKVVKLDEAVGRLKQRTDGSWQADMYLLANELRGQRR